MISSLGRQFILFFSEVGGGFLLFWKVLLQTRYLWKDKHLLVLQMLEIGVNSLPLIIVVSIFTGAVSAWQASYQFHGLVSLEFIGPATAAAVFIELGPVLTALILAGRVGASIAAELGTMKVTEQIDALQTLAIDPVRYLAMPRVFSGFIMMPILVIFADLVAILGAFLIVNLFMGLSPNEYFGAIQRYFSLRLLLSGIAKAFIFGGTIALVGCYVGFATSGGAEGVGKSTIKAFVISSALILIDDYIMATILF